MTVLLCRFEQRCRDATRTIVDGKTVAVAAAAGPRGLCFGCEQFSRAAVAELGDLYWQLHAELGKDSGRNISPDPGRGPDAKVDPPAPIRLAVDAQCREIAWVLQVWATPVWDRVDAGRHQRDASPDVAGWEPRRCARLLVTYYPALCALPPTAYLPYARDGGPVEPVELDGPGAVVALVDLHHPARGWVGDTVRVQSRDLPCPPADRGGCGRTGVLVQEIGAGLVACKVCGWTCTDDEYGAYAITLVPPRARHRLGVQ